MVKVIIVNGYGGCGKDTFCRLCREWVGTYKTEKLPPEKKKNKDKLSDFDKTIADLSVHKDSTITFPKKVATAGGWNGGKTEKDRQFLSDIKAALKKYNNSPEESVISKIMEIEKDAVPPYFKENYFLWFVDIREKEDIESFQKACKDHGWDCTTLRVIRPGDVGTEPQSIKNDIDSVKYEYTLYNIDLTDLENSAKYFMEETINSFLKEK